MERYRFGAYARTIAEQHDLTVVLEDGCSQPRTDGKHLYVAAPSAGWYDEQWDQWYYELMHEIGHQREPWREWKDVMQHHKISRANILGPLNNLNSDHAQEHDGYGMYRGIDMKLGEGRRKFVLKDTAIKAPKDEEQAAWMACWKYDALKRADWNPCMIGVSDMLDMHPDVTPYYDKLVAWGKSAGDCTDEWMVYEYTKEMLDVIGLDPEKLEQESQEQYDKAEGGSGEDTTPDGEGSDAGEDSGKGDAKSKTAFYDPYLSHDHTDQGYSKDSMDVDYSRHTRQPRFIRRDPLVIDFKRGINTDILSDSHEFEGMRGGAGFANRVRRLLQVKSATRYEGGKRRGRVNPRGLWRVGVNDDKVFRTKVENLNLKDVAVTVLVDFSGSMGGERIEHATKAALLLNQAITRIGVPVAVTGFSDALVRSKPRPLSLRIQQHGERLSDDELLRRFGMAATRMQNNSDGEAVLDALSVLLKQQSKRKVLVVLSDGYPASWADGDDDWYLNKVVKEAESVPNLSVYAVGIQSDAVNRYYKNRCTINNAHELEEKLLEVVRDQIITGE